MKLSLRGILLACQIVTAALVTGLLAANITVIRHDQAALSELYDQRVVPLRHLKTVSDAYAVFVVDASHKVRNGNWGWDDAAASVAKAKTDIAAAWAAFTESRADAAERAALGTVLARMREADVLTRDLAAAIAARDEAALTRIVRERLYQTLDPLTEALDAVVAGETARAEETHAAAAATQAAALQLAIGLAVLAALLMLGSWLLVQTRIATPLGRLTADMGRLAGGDTAIAITGTTRADEIGAMAQALETFRDAMQASAQLRAEQDSLRADSQAQQARALNQMATRVEEDTKGAVGAITDKAAAMRREAAEVTGIAGRLDGNAATVAAAAEESQKVAETVAAAAEELSASIRGISGQIAEAARVSRQTTSDSSATEQTIRGLSEAVGRIGEVTTLIQEIAGKTNLLALNATIEAARAGDAGKGFAVVAGEVKGLATQTARATEDIARHIESVRERTEAAVENVRRISEAVGRMDGLAAGIASAIGQQDAATQEIARGMATASAAARQVTGRIAEVSADAREAGARASSTETLVGEVAADAGQLMHRLVELVRTSVPEVDRRTEPRHPLSLPVTVEAGGARHVGRLADVSLHGAAFTGVPALATGQTVRLAIGDVGGIEARVLHHEDGRVSVRFTREQPALLERLLGRMLQAA